MWAVGPASAQSDELRIGTTNMPPSLGNPYRNTGTPHIFTWSGTFDGLTRIDHAGHVVPWLAVRWDNIDPLTWRIRLRPNVTFSNGAPFTADAVINALSYLRSPEAARDVVAREFEFVAGATAIDDLTVEIITDRPVPTLPRSLPLLYMVEPETWRRLGPDGFARAPIATGPYKVDEMSANGWRLSAFAESWRAPKIPKLRWIAAPDAAARVQGILSDQLDIALGIGPDEAAAVEAGGGKSATWRTAAVWAIQLHQYRRNTPLADRRVREALNIAIDRKMLIDGLLAGTTVAATQPATEATYGYDPSISPIPHDPARAKQLLADAGYADGFTFVVQAVVGAGPADGAVYQQVAQDLAAVGVTMQISQFPVPELIRAVTEGDWNGDGFGLTYASEPTVDALRPMQTHSCAWRHPWYCNPDIMPTIAAAQTEFDPAKALALRQQVMRFYRDDWASIFLYELPRFAGLRAGIGGFEELYGFVNVDEITKSN